MWKTFIVVFLMVQGVLSCPSSKNEDSSEDSNEVEETGVNKGTENEIILSLQLQNKLKNRNFFHSLKLTKLLNSKERYM